MKKHVKIIIIVLVVLVAVAGGIYSLTASVPLPLTSVALKTAELTFSEQGIMTARNVISVYPLAHGGLLRVNVREGQLVRAGDVLCVIDDKPLLLRKLELQGVINGYEAQMRSAETQDRSNGAITADKLVLQNALIEQNQRDLDRAIDALSRTEILFAGGGASQSEVNDAQALVEKCQSALTASRHERAIIAAGSEASGMADYYKALIDSNQATLAQLEWEIENCSVKAPVSGVVTRLPVSDSNIVNAGSPVAEITETEGALIEAFVSTQDVSYVRAGDKVELLLKRREGDLRFPGWITQVDAAAEARLSTLGVEEYKVKVWISPDMTGIEGLSLGIGFSVDVRFVVYQEDDKITVPKTALYKEDGRDMLWVVRDGKAKAIEVALGMELRTETVVESGLVAGDIVVTDANDSTLKDGVKIKNE
ncbi:MAG: efflux RND transporter periplasmic adaptor subunit [Peptococcaceae bacterium]|jgi:HlyD family secretion protein|nr:efflux RND transporter periplasmic adaptor subunit [Peptococcaceae bacterium]